MDMRVSTTQPPLGTPLDRSHPLAVGLVANWLLNEGGGTKAFDSTGICNVPGALTNGAVFQQSRRGNVVLTAATGGKYVELGTPSALQFTSTNPFSVSLWAYPTNATAAGLFTYALNGASGWYLSYSAASANSILFDYFGANGAFTRVLTATTTVPTNVWTYITVTRDGVNSSTSNTAYLNGVLIGTKSQGGGAPTSIVYAGKTAQIGARQQAIHFTGLVGDAKVYNRCLSQTEIWQLYTNSYQMYQTGRPLKIAV